MKMIPESTLSDILQQFNRLMASGRVEGDHVHIKHRPRETESRYVRPLAEPKLLEYEVYTFERDESGEWCLRL